MVCKQQDLFLTFLEAGKSTIKVLADSVSGEGWFLAHAGLPFHCVQQDGRGKEVLQGFFNKGFNCIQRTSPS